MQATALTDAALLRRSTLAAVVEESPANPTSLTAARPTSAARDTFDRRHDQDQLEYSTDARLNPYMAPTRPESRYRDDSDRPSLADWGHAPSAPVPGSSRWYDSSSTPVTNRPISVPLPSHAYDRGSPFSHQHQHQQHQHPQQSQPVAGSSSSSSSPHPYLGMSRLQQQWAKAPATQYQPYRISIAPEPSRAPGGGEPDREHPRMQPPSFAHFQPEPSAPLLPPPSSYPYSAGPLPSEHMNSAYTQPLSLTLPPLANSFPSEPFALTSTYPPPASNGNHYRYHSNGQASNDASEQADYSSNGHEQPSGVTEAYSASRQSGPLSVSLPRANNADPASYAESLAAAVPPGSAQPNSRKRKEPKDAASRKYACNECEQKFARPSALATHILTHTREKPFVCMTCSRGFAVMSNLRRHCRVRSHALAPSQESNAKRVGEYGSDLAGAGKGDADASPDDAVSAPSEIPLRPLPVAPSENTPTAFTLPAQSVYPP